MQRLYDSFTNEVSNTIFWHELFRVLYDIKRIYVVQRTHTTSHVLDLKLDLKNKRFKSKKRRSIKWTEAWSSIDYITGRDNFCVYVVRFSIIVFHRICYKGCYSYWNIFSFLEKVHVEGLILWFARYWKWQSMGFIEPYVCAIYTSWSFWVTFRNIMNQGDVKIAYQYVSYQTEKYLLLLISRMFVSINRL